MYDEFSFNRSQIRTTLKKKAFEEAGISIRKQTPNQTINKQQTNQSISCGKSSEVTLNMLNAPESEVDVEDLPEECNVKLEFEGPTEEVTA